MENLSRRSFITTGTIAGIGTITGVSSCKTGNRETSSVTSRNHPLDGVERENIKITGLKVTLLSCELPPEEQWYLDWIPERYKCWKTDSILVEVFTDQGIKGIGGATQYGGPDVVKKYL